MPGSTRRACGLQRSVASMKESFHTQRFTPPQHRVPYSPQRTTLIRTRVLHAVAVDRVARSGAEATGLPRCSIATPWGNVHVFACACAPTRAFRPVCAAFLRSGHAHTQTAPGDSSREPLRFCRQVALTGVGTCVVSLPAPDRARRWRRRPGRSRHHHPRQRQPPGSR